MRELTKKEIFNAKSNSIALKDCTEEINVMAVTIDSGKDGGAVGYMYTDKGFYTTTSATALDLIIELADFEDESVKIRVLKRKSKNNREFLTLELI